MKEYKISKQKGYLLKNSDSEFKGKLNRLAREGWRVVYANHMAESNSSR